jgi:hypothetical protein
MAIKFLNTVAVETDVLYVNASTNKVGIGTTSPNTALEVDGAISTTTSDYVQGSTGSRLLLETSGSGNTHSYIQAQSAGGTTSNEDLALQLYGGNVGINNSSPNEKLEVDGVIRTNNYSASLILNSTNTTGGRTTVYATKQNGAISPPQGYIQWNWGQYSEYSKWEVRDPNTLTNYSNINLPYGSSGGDFQIDLSTNTALVIGRTALDIGIDNNIYHLGDTDTKFGFVANDNFAISTAGSERVRVTSGGSVGIATNNPSAKLDVEGNAVIGSTLNTATGQWAVAIGNDNTSSGLDSLATGETTTASGRQSFSGGFNTTASGDASFAVGGGTTASGENAFAACGTTVASGISSAAFGAFSEATATNAFAINGDTTASGESSFSLGVSTNARGLASIASGLSCNTAVNALGAFAGGTVANANGNFSIAYGDVANASGRVSQALGYIVNAIGQYSFAQGFNNTVSGTASAVFGQQNTSHGSAAWSLSTGFLNQTRHSASLTIGSHNGMTASSSSREQFMLGRYLNVPRNNSGTPSAGCLVVGEHNAYLNRPNVKFAVGTGVGVGVEQDSFTVLKDGNVLMEQIVNKNYSSDSAAAAGGVPVGGIYHNSGDLKIRRT